MGEKRDHEIDLEMIDKIGAEYLPADEDQEMSQSSQELSEIR